MTGVGREALKQRIRDEVFPFMERIIEEKLAELRRSGDEVAPHAFLIALREFYPRAEAQWRAERKGAVIDELQLSLRREVYMEIIETLLRRASN